MLLDVLVSLLIASGAFLTVLGSFAVTSLIAARADKQVHAIIQSINVYSESRNTVWGKSEAYQ